MLAAPALFGPCGSLGSLGSLVNGNDSLSMAPVGMVLQGNIYNHHPWNVVLDMATDSLLDTRSGYFSSLSL